MPVIIQYEALFWGYTNSQFSKLSMKLNNLGQLNILTNNKLAKNMFPYIFVCFHANVHAHTYLDAYYITVYTYFYLNDPPIYT